MCAETTARHVVSPMAPASAPSLLLCATGPRPTLTSVV